ncbi:MAG: hypothetical protein GX558_12400 [Clostridiales bacterium]|nr:hypothetical protein [Clostridiales bacterium]
MQNHRSTESIGFLAAIAAALIALAVFLLLHSARPAPAREYRDASFVRASQGGGGHV